MKHLILSTLVLLPLTSFAQSINIQCKNPDKGVTLIQLKNQDLQKNSAKDISQIIHSNVKAEYWEVTAKSQGSLSLTYLLEDEPASMYLDGKYQLTLTQKQAGGDYSAAFYRRYDDKTLTYSCRKI